MNDLPIQKLTALRKHFGKDLLKDYGRCDELLVDLCGIYRLEISLLVSALRDGCAIKLENSAINGCITNEVTTQLAKQLRDNSGILFEYSIWSVISLAKVLELQLVESQGLGSLPDRENNVCEQITKCPHCNIADAHKFIRELDTTTDYRCICCNKPFFVNKKRCG